MPEEHQAKTHRDHKIFSGKSTQALQNFIAIWMINIVCQLLIITYSVPLQPNFFTKLTPSSSACERLARVNQGTLLMITALLTGGLYTSAAAKWAMILIAPADSPIKVMLLLSPPNAPMCLLTQSSASRWSSKPKLHGFEGFSRVNAGCAKNPKNPRR